MSDSTQLKWNYIQEGPYGQRAWGGGEGRGDLGVRFDKLNELGGEAGEVLEPAVPELVEGSKGRGRGQRGSDGVPLGLVSILRQAQDSTRSGRRSLSFLPLSHEGRGGRQESCRSHRNSFPLAFFCPAFISPHFWGITYKMILDLISTPFDPSMFRQAQGTIGSGTFPSLSSLSLSKRTPRSPRSSYPTPTHRLSDTRQSCSSLRKLFPVLISPLTTPQGGKRMKHEMKQDRAIAPPPRKR